MTFTNKCSLHLHVNSHGKKYMDLSKVTVKAPEMADLLVNYANFFNGSSNSTIHKMIDKCKKTHSNVDLNNAYLSKNNSKTDITSSVDTLVNAENNILIEKDGISGSQDFTCCPICHTLFKKSGESLIRELITNHFQYLDDSEDFYNLCKKCNRFLPNKCAMSAHEEFHNKSSPYVCPECGMTFSSFLLLEKHTKLTCFHSDRLMVIKCVAEGCNFMCFEPKINEHFTQSHTKLIIQCAECVEKFENKEQLIAHSKCVHNEELASGQNVYECQVCMQVIAKDDAYHALSHFCDAIKANYLYVCNGCRFYFSRICTFKQHLVKCVPYQRKVNPKMNDSKTIVRLKGNVNKLVRVKYRKINRKSINKKSEKSMTVTPQGINLKKVNSKTVKSMKDNSITDDSMTDDTMMDNPEIIEKVIQNGLPSTYNAVENVSDITN